jgi:NAD(P)-dependent dehydrogenase (short-subunit alcohol dehydrogenase family)
MISFFLRSYIDDCAYVKTSKRGEGYDASRAAVNSFTAHPAYELKDTPIKVNAAHFWPVRLPVLSTAQICGLMEASSRQSIR